jgi:hypothetical protein
LVREQPDYSPALCVLGLIDAALGHKEDALREGRRAIELLPVTKDAVNGGNMIEFFAIACAWAGEKDLALQQLALAIQNPSFLSYGQLKLHPYWTRSAAIRASRESSLHSRRSSPLSANRTVASGSP